MKKVMIFGTFDIIHPGHVYLLQEAKKHGDFLTVIIARDATVQQVKGRQPMHDEAARVKNMENLGIADKVRLGSHGDKYQVIIEENPNVLVLGYDQTHFVDKLQALADAHGWQIVRLPAYKPELYKSSKIRTLLQQALAG